VPLLEVEDLWAGYGSSAVLDGVSLSVEEGETDALLGRTGAGKSTALLCVAGFLRPWSGSIRFDGRDLSGADTRTLVSQGIALVPQGRHGFAELTVAQNLGVAARSTGRGQAAPARNRQLVFDLFPVLAERSDHLARRLSTDQLQLLSVGRAIMTSPRILLVDEVSGGLDPGRSQELFRLSRRMNAEGITLLFSEQNAGILRHADRAFVLENGRVLSAGTAREIAVGNELREAYLTERVGG
jgi:branched-chain amino acid transport system ATP-binding protein